MGYRGFKPPVPPNHIPPPPPPPEFQVGEPESSKQPPKDTSCGVDTITSVAFGLWLGSFLDD